MKVSGGERRIERDGLLKLRRGLIILFVLGEQRSEGVVQGSIIRKVGESELQLFLRGICLRNRGEGGGVSDCDFRCQRLRRVCVRAVEELEQVDGFCIAVELGVREGKVGCCRQVPVVESVGLLELSYCRAEVAFSQEHGTECSMTGRYW